MGKKATEFNGYMETSMCLSQAFIDEKNRGSKILVVDDHVENFSIIEGFLIVLGYKNHKNNLITEINGSGALKQIQQAFEEKDPARFTLILIECKMSLMDGYETIKKIRRLYEGIGLPKPCWPKFVATTCMTEPVHQKKALASGFDDVLTKPLSI